MSKNLERDTNTVPAVTWNRAIVVCAAIATLLLVVAVAAFLIVANPSPLLNNDREHPSDAALEAMFSEHEADFEKLIAMSNADAKVVRIAPDFTWLDDNARWPRPETEIGFSQERWNEYRELFKVLSLTKGLARHPDGQTIELIASTQGLLTGGSGKGYVYSTKELTPLRDALDNLGPTGKHVYKQLKPPNWYLFYYSH